MLNPDPTDADPRDGAAPRDRDGAGAEDSGAGESGGPDRPASGGAGKKKKAAGGKAKAEPKGSLEDLALALPGVPVPGVAPELDELGPVLDDEVVDALDDDFGDDDEDDFDEEDEEGGEGDEEGGAPRKPAAKKRKASDEEEEVALPDTPVPTPKKMLAALEKAFEGQEDVDARLLERFAQHAVAVLETNRVMNLTAITDPVEVAIKHYLDSWRITRIVPLMARRVLDLGSGGGFPGIPIALSEPMCSVLLCESIQKKAKFLEEVVAKLGLRNVRVIHERAEDFLARERVDLVVVRAVSSVRENIRTLRKVRHALQDLVMYKGSSWGREVRAAEREAERLGFKLDTVMEHDLPEEMGRHAILVYRAPGGAGF